MVKFTCVVFYYIMSNCGYFCSDESCYGNTAESKYTYLALVHENLCSGLLIKINSLLDLAANTFISYTYFSLVEL